MINLELLTLMAVDLERGFDGGFDFSDLGGFGDIFESFLEVVVVRQEEEMDHKRVQI